MQNEALAKVREFVAAQNLRIFILARKSRLRVRIEGAGYGSGFSQNLDSLAPPGYKWFCTSGGPDGMNFSLWEVDSAGGLKNPWKEAADKRKAEDIESGRRFPRANVSNCPFPHCDQRILHAPGECIHCDSFPVYQYYRQALGINFTGHRLSGLTKCPAEVARNLDVIERWGGNVPTTQADIDAADEETRKMFDEIREKMK